MNTTYLKYELVRLFRNKRFFFFTLAFPLALFLIFGLTNKDAAITKGSPIKFSLFYMVAMAGYGSMLGALSGGARIAAERAVGWNRQLRLTPLTPRNYFRTKVITTYLMCLLSIVILFAAGLAIGAHVDSVSALFGMLGLILVGLLPFVALGIALGHLLTVDSMGPALGGLGSLFALIGGMWFPLTGGVLQDIGKLTPGYWIAQGSRVGIGEKPWGTEGWIVVAVWAAAMTALAVWTYQRDTQRV